MGRNLTGGAWWLLLIPGLLLTLMAISILIWPELLAYMVASVILAIGLTLTGWALTIRLTEKRIRKNISNMNQDFTTRQPDHDQVIYYER